MRSSGHHLMMSLDTHQACSPAGNLTNLCTENKEGEKKVEKYKLGKLG